MIDEKRYIGLKLKNIDVLELSHKTGRRYYFKCICKNCGEEHIIRSDELSYYVNNNRDCKCMHEYKKDKRYIIARSIHFRCTNPKSSSWKRYGGRGIKCLLGNTFDEIYNSLLKVDGYFDGAEIDRINNDGNYELGNLRWVTKRENIHNSSWCKCMSHYETFATMRSHFKETCLARDWIFDNFIEIDSGERVGRNRKFFYKLKEGVRC